MPLYNDDDLFKDSTMTFGQHLEELRVYMLRALYGLVAGVLVGLLVADYVVAFIQTPVQNALQKYYQPKSTSGTPKGFVADEYFVNPQDLLDQLKPTGQPATGTASNDGKDGVKEAPSPDALRPIILYQRIENSHLTQVETFSPHEAFTIWLKAAIITGFVLSSPWVFYQMWLFVAAGLYPHEKHYIYIFLPISLGLFFFGVGLAFFFVFEPVLDFLFGFNRSMGINPNMRISEWISFVLFLPIGFGISFQLPLVMLFLQRIHVFSIEVYLKNWRIAILVIAILSAILTPADPYSMLLMAIPLSVLYFLGVGLCHYLPRAHAHQEEEEKLAV